MRASGAKVAVCLILLGGCTTGPTFTSHSYEVVTTNAGGDQLRSAISMTHQALGNWAENPDGSRSDSSFSQHGKSWKDAKGRVEATRVQTEFESRDGSHCVIEDISIPGKWTIVLLSSDNDNAAMELNNEFVKHLCEEGVKAKER